MVIRTMIIISFIFEVSKIISQRKEQYHYHLASKLNNPSTSSKTYWSIFKNLL